VEQQLTNNNVNAGGSFVEAGLQQINVREVGLVRNVHDIENTVIQVYGDDLQILEDTANEVAGLMRQVKGIEDLGVFCVLGQPNLNVTVDRQQAVRYQINVADVQDAIQTAVGGNALTQVLLGEARYDLVLRYLPQYRDKEEAIQNIRLLSPGGERVSLAQLCRIEERDGASEIYREGNQRYIAIKYSVRGRDLGSAVEEAITKVKEKVKLPTGYHIEHNNVTSGLRARPGERR
jgi:cobalt-zinc-cadmium resistance protein CzcA